MQTNRDAGAGRHTLSDDELATVSAAETAKEWAARMNAQFNNGIVWGKHGNYDHISHPQSENRGG